MANTAYNVINSKRTVLYERDGKVNRLLPYSLLNIDGTAFIETNPYASKEIPEGDGTSGFALPGIGKLTEEQFVTRSLGMRSSPEVNGTTRTLPAKDTQVHVAGWI